MRDDAPTHGSSPAPRRRRGRRRLAVGVLAAGALLAGVACSSSDSGGTTGGTGGQGAAALPPCPLDALDKASQPVEVVVWHTQGVKTLDAMKQLVDKYNASQQKVKVRLESQGSSYEEIQRKFNASVASKQLPGVIMVDDTFVQSMADSGVILPAQSCVDADKYDMSNFSKTAMDYYTIRGVLWPAAANPANILLFYNPAHFRKAGLDPAKPPKDLAEVRQYAEKLKAAGASEKPLVHAFETWKTEFWLTGARSSVVNNDNGRGGGTTDKATLQGNERATELFTWFKDMQAAGLLEAIPGTEGVVNQYFALAQQKSSMLVETSSAATSIEAFLGGNLDTSSLAPGQTVPQNVSGLDLTAAGFPGMIPNGKTQMGGPAWYITNTTPPEVQAGAWDFLKFMNNPESQAAMLRVGSFLPYNKAALDLPDVQAYFNDTLSGRWLKIAYDQIQNIDPTFPGPLIGPYDQFRRSLREAQDQLMFNNASPEDVLTKAQTQVDDALTKYNREVGS